MGQRRLLEPTGLAANTVFGRPIAWIVRLSFFLENIIQYERADHIAFGQQATRRSKVGPLPPVCRILLSLDVSWPK